MATHIPMRECIGCGRKFAKQSLVRIVKKNGEIFLDSGGKASGRGAYICLDAECMELCLKRKKLNRAFRQNVSEEIYSKILQEMRRCIE